MSKELNKAPVEQAGGDERAAFFKHLIGRHPAHETEIVRVVEHNHAAWKAWQARAALAQPSLMPPDRGPWHAVKWDGGRRVDLSSDDFEHDVALTVSGDFVEGDKFRYAQELAAWMNAHLAQPSPARAEQAEAERPEVVARVVHSNPFVLDHCGPLNANDELMTVAQHAASVARWAEMFNRVEQQRDVAQARVAELELKLDQSDYAYDNDRHHMRGMAKQAAEAIQVFTGHDSGANLAHRYGEKWWEHLDELRDALLAFAKNAPPAQAQHSVPEGWVQSLPLKDHQPCKPNEDRANGYTIPIYSRPALVEEALRKLRAVLCDPIGNVVIGGSDGDREEVQQALGMLAAAPGKEVGHE
ncbi:hypothetical protein [Pseudomonas aeruginosa]|uniref:hypothetical protein n=1 Tax=Pseudomonas aeruginosa TaxID=287 RepID=UPI000690EF88|nr:hypothetical protein [Pseudomonas aeruginosa]HCL3371386.1 hypothetical protein [Pseudomonas aeruginosa]HCU2535378.1 hypothetical protein [Pseudomonas aeruginosa]